MISIKRAAPKDHQDIINIGSVSVKEAHLGSCPDEDLQAYMDSHYNADAIIKELENPSFLYHILYYNGKAAGFSKIILNTAHESIEEKNVTKLDRIYLLSEYFGLKLGAELMKFNIELARQHQQAGLWLVTWIDNTRAISFYKKAGFEIAGLTKFWVTTTTFNDNHLMYHRIKD